MNTWRALAVIDTVSCMRVEPKNVFATISRDAAMWLTVSDGAGVGVATGSAVTGFARRLCRAIEKFPIKRRRETTVHIQTLRLALVVAVLLVVLEGCQFSVSTANLSGLKIGKDKSVSQETSTFGATDSVYGVATVDNAPGKVKVKGRLIADDVPGEQNGPIPGAESTVDLPGSGTATFTFTPPSNGWPKGKYKVEAIMLDENGQQKDQKTASFSVT